MFTRSVWLNIFALVVWQRWNIPCLAVEGWQSDGLSCTEKDGSFLCQFGLEAGDSVAAEKSTIFLPQVCIKDICLEAEISTTIKPYPRTQTERTHTVDLPNDDATKREDGDVESLNLEVGKATYRPPYTEHGNRVRAILLAAPPPISRKPEQEQVIRWARWYFDLANAHYPSTGDDVREDDVWVQVEFSINAYRQAIQIFEDNDDLDPPIPPTDRGAFLGMVHYQLGEAYFLDPELTHSEEALECYQKAQKCFEDLLENHRTQLSNLREIERKYADAGTKLGMAIISSMDPMEHAPAWIDSFMGTVSSENVDFQEGHSYTNHRRGIDDLSSTTRSQIAFDKAIIIYKKHLADDVDMPLPKAGNSATMRTREQMDLQIGYALVLQHSAANYALSGNHQNAKRQYEDAIAIHGEALLPQLQSNDFYNIQEIHNCYTALADLNFNLAETCIQLGDYPCAKEAYEKAMGVYTNHNIDIAPVQSIEDLGGQIDEAIKETLTTLQEYRASVRGGTSHHRRATTSPRGLEESSEYYYQEDSGYEGDLLASLGTLYLSMGSIERSIAFLEEAAEKYSESEADLESPIMADLKINLAMAYYRTYRFTESKRAQWEALDIYQKLYGDGVNPYIQGMDEYEQSLFQETGDYGDSFFHQQKPVGKNDKQDKSTGSSSSTSKIQVEESAGSQRKGHQIDLEQYRQSIKNITEATPRTPELQGEL